MEVGAKGKLQTPYASLAFKLHHRLGPVKPPPPPAPSAQLTLATSSLCSESLLCGASCLKQLCWPIRPSVKSQGETSLCPQLSRPLFLALPALCCTASWLQ
ncbi:hypothetical protein KIL84_005866 [Mauremys mutica]|uniref:Uncharacterized protein n=1 Tax=Mauremys mutica TaxID=74926 RepID=A0A9D3XHH7_9SAUR|nr:hypothetical protein KIL84_005866 [Mauremys mutica]